MAQLTDEKRKAVRRAISGQDEEPVELETTSTKELEHEHTTTAPSQGIEITHEEVYNVMQALYPDQTARCIAEIKALKYQQLYEGVSND